MVFRKNIRERRFRVTNRLGRRSYRALQGMYDPQTMGYPPGIKCILTNDKEINIADWGDGSSSENTALTGPATGEMKTLVGIYYPSWYTGPIGTWTEAQVREALTNDLEEAIYNWSDGNTKLVGPNGGQVMIDGPTQFFGTCVDPGNHNISPCEGGNGCPTGTHFKHQVYAAMTAACPTCDVKTALMLACPRGTVGNPLINNQPPSTSFPPIRGYAGSTLQSITWTDGAIGYNGSNVTGGGCGQAPGVGPGAYIPENDIELLNNGRIKLIMLHEMMHTMNWPHTNRPMVGFNPSTWCPTFFAQNGPQFPCTNSSGNYRGQDNLGLMAYGAYCQNPYSVFDAHPTAASKYLRGLGLSPNDDGTWLPDNAVLHLDLSPGDSETVRLYAHDTKANVKEDTLRDITTGATGDAFTVDPTTGQGVIPYLIKIKRPVDITQTSDSWPVDDKALFISYRMNSWYNLKNQSDPDTGNENLSEASWAQGGYLNGSVIMDWGPINPFGNKSTALSLYKYDAEDVRLPPAAPNQTLEGYIANGNAYPKLELRILENAGSVPVNSRSGPSSILVQIKAL